MKYLTLLLILVLSLVLLCFLYLNQGLVTIKYFPGTGHQTPPVPLFAVIMLAVIAGVLMAGLIAMGEQLRLRLRLRQAVRARAGLERRVAELEGAREGGGAPAGEVPDLIADGDSAKALPDQFSAEAE